MKRVPTTTLLKESMPSVAAVVLFGIISVACRVCAIWKAIGASQLVDCPIQAALTKREHASRLEKTLVFYGCLYRLPFTAMSMQMQSSLKVASHTHCIVRLVIGG